MFKNSIHFRMTIWYALVFGLVVLVFSILLYENFSNSLNSDLNNLLQAKGEDISQIIGSFNEEDLSENSGDLSPAGADLINAAKYAVEKNTSSNIFIQIFDAHGVVIIYSVNIPASLKLKNIKSLQKTREEKYFSDISVREQGQKRKLYRAFTVYVSGKFNSPHYIRVSGAMTSIKKELNRLKTELFLFFPVAMFIIIGLGQFLTKMALNPVDNMTKAINQITAENLGRKISIPDANDEIKNLAETFNNMLARIDGVFSSQRRFIQDISHELRTPLTALKGNQEVSLAKKRTQEEYENVLEVNLEEINRMTQLVENLLLIARLENKEIKPELQQVNIESIVSQVISSMKVLAESKGINIKYKAESKAIASAVHEQVFRVVTNILDNAIKYTPAHGVIEVRSYREGNNACLSVKNSGDGFSENDKDKIFDRFYRIDPSRSESGFGLGLSIAKSIIESFNGRIEAESFPGKWAKFTIFMPAHIV